MPGLGDFVTEYIDVILLGAVAATIIVTAWHYVSERRKLAKERAAESADHTPTADEATPE